MNSGSAGVPPAHSLGQLRGRADGTPALPILLALVLLLSGCVGGAPPADRFYRLDVAAPPVQPAPLLPGVVEVTRFGAEGMTGDRALLYSYQNNPGEERRYSYDMWVEPPPVLVQDQLVRALRHARIANLVVTSDLRVAPDYIIEGRLRRFEQLAGPQPAVMVEADIGVVRLHGNELLMLNTYRVEKPAKTQEAPDAVDAFQAALTEVFARFVTDLAAHSQIPLRQAP